MIKAKAGGIVLGGLAAYLILSKGIGAAERGIRNICVAHEWKNYYKYGSKDGNMVPPGYTMHTRKDADGNNVDTGTPEAIRRANSDTSNKSVGVQITEAIFKAVSDVFDKEKRKKEASEGQETVSEEDDCEKSVATEEEMESMMMDDLKKDIKEKGFISEETEEDDALTLDFSENPDGEFVDKEGNKV